MIFSTFFDDIFGKDVFMGDNVWICHFDWLSPGSEYNETIRPQEVTIVDTFTAYGNNKKALSGIHFKPVDDTENTEILSPQNKYAKTVHVFLTEKECLEYYVSECQDGLDHITRYAIDNGKMFDELEEKVLDLKAAFQSSNIH